MVIEKQHILVHILSLPHILRRLQVLRVLRVLQLLPRYYSNYISSVTGTRATTGLQLLQAPRNYHIYSSSVLPNTTETTATTGMLTKCLAWSSRSTILKAYALKWNWLRCPTVAEIAPQHGRYNLAKCKIFFRNARSSQGHFGFCSLWIFWLSFSLWQHF